MRTCAVAVDVDGPVEHFRKCLNLEMVAVDAQVALPLDIISDFFRHVLRVVVGILFL